MAVYFHTFDKPFDLPEKELGHTDWSPLLLFHKNMEVMCPAGLRDDISTPISHGPRRSVLETYESPRDRQNVIGRVVVYRMPDPRLQSVKGEKEVPAAEIPETRAPLDETNRFYPIYQPGENGKVMVYGLTHYVEFTQVRTEDRIAAEVCA